MAKNKNNNKKRDYLSFPTKLKKWIWGILFFLLAIIMTFSFFGAAGIVGEVLMRIFNPLIGKTIFLLPLIFVVTGFVFLKTKYRKFLLPTVISILVLVSGFSGILSNLNTLKAGGSLGNWLSFFFSKFFGFWISQIIFLFQIIIGVLIFWFLLTPPKLLLVEKEEKGEKPELAKESKTEEKPLLTRIFKKVIIPKPKFKIKEIEPSLGQSQEEKPAPTTSLSLKTKPIELTEIPSYPKPPFDLLESDKGQPTVGDTRTNAAIIKKTLENFGILVEMSEINIGPTVTQYTLKPAEGVKLSKITGLSNDLALALAAHPIRIEAPIPGRSLVGIEIPNKERAQVRLRNLIENPFFQNSKSNLSFVLGRDVSGNPVYADLAKMPHLLVAGSTGTGKTCGADTLLFTEKGMLTFEELCPLPLNSEINFKIKLVTRDGIEETAKNYNNGICQFYKLSTQRGYQIEVTAEHPLWVRNGDGSQGWKQAALIKKGDYLAINREPALFGNRIDLSGFKPRKVEGKSKKISLPSKMTSQLAQFLGLLTADGFFVEKKGIQRLVYSQANPKLLSLYKKLLKELFGISQFIKKKSGFNLNTKVREIEVNGSQLKEFLTYLGMKSLKTSQKEIPRAIREAPKEIVVSYLKCLFDSDGYTNGDSIKLSSRSEKLLSQVQIILLNFGIISSLKSKKGKIYCQNKYLCLTLSGEDVRRFIKEIGFLRREKYRKAKNLLKLKANFNVDVISHIFQLKGIGQKYLNHFTPLINRGWNYQSASKYAFSSLEGYNSGDRVSSYRALEKILDFYQPISQELEYRPLKEISERKFYWDKIEKIERTVGIGYDFYVPGSDSFVGNGFVNHNTIFLNSLILSLLYQNSPETLRFILIDPKRVEFPVYQDLPHLLVPVIFDAQKTVNVLKWLVLEMERRFDLLAEFKARDIASYNNMAAIRKGITPLPYIILIIDELADLMAARGREIEAGIVRLTQMARAVGIHLVVATQRPSVEVITGLIKANITSRVALQVASQVDSRTILDTAGAEKLLGSGDLLFISAEVIKPKRIQGAYVSEKEVKRVVQWLKSKIAPPKFEFDPREISEGEDLALPEERLVHFPEEDPLYQKAKTVVIEARKASASLLQRRLRIGYARAARLIDMLEQRGVVGPGKGAKPREVYFKEDQENEGWQKI